jgi:hypothetical protein
VELVGGRNRGGVHDDDGWLEHRSGGGDVTGRAPCKLEAVVLGEGVREQLAVQAHIGYEKHANAFSSAAA